MKTQPRTFAALIGAGCALQILFVAFTLLYVNVPPGSNAMHGLNPQAVGLFRALWSYPVLSLPPDVFQAVAALTIVALWVVYLGAAALISPRSGSDEQRRQTCAILVVACLLNGMLVLFMPPVLSLDIYHYALFGRMVALYHLNPYVAENVAAGGAASNDVFWSLATDGVMPTQYGPVWTLLSAAAAMLGGGSVVGTLLVFKATVALFNVAGGVLMYLLARRLRGAEAVRALLLYAWNPLVLIESAGSAHNDVVMISIAIFAVLLATQGRMLGGLAVLLLSAAVKYLTMLLVLLYVVHCLVRETSRARMAALAARMGGVFVMVLCTLYLPFLAGVATPGKFLAGLAPSLNPAPNAVRTGLTSVLAIWRGTVGASAPASQVSVPIILNVGFAMLLALLLRGMTAVRTDWRQVLGKFSVASLIYVYIVFGASFPWYLISPLTTALLGPETRANRYLVATCIGLGIGLMWGYANLIAT